MEHPPGTIVVPNSGLLRHTASVEALLSVKKPLGTQLILAPGPLVTKNLNQALQMLHGEWAWLQADDHVYKQDLLYRLLDHEAPVVVPLVLKRSQPHQLVIGSEAVYEDEDVGRNYPAYVPIELDAVPDKPFTVEIAGTAGMLVRKEVFEAVGYPYFESTDGLYLNEDIEFSRKVRAAGFEILADPDAHIGHIISTPIWPVR